ncbi:hypothetical protein ACSZOH_15925 [Aeromonas caviae]
MANEYYERLSEMNPGDLADGLAMEAEFDAISQGFSKLPTPHTGGQGFDGPVRVGDAVNSDEAVNKGQLDNALGTAKLLPIAVYGDFNADAWAVLPSGSYLLFGAGSQFSDAPWVLAEAKTYSVAVRHVIGDAGVSLYLDELVLSSSDDASCVDLGCSAWRSGQDLTTAIGGGWRYDRQWLDHKQSVRATTTAGITLTAPQTIDGVVLAVGDRVLVKDQADAKANGIYLVAAGAWTRTTDADTGAKLSSGARVYIEEGAVNGARVWYLATAGVITIGTTLLQFKDEHPAATQQQPGVSRFATQAEAVAGLLDSVAVAPKELAAAINARYLAAGTPLPAADIGPIWHDDYNDWMTWRVFDQNGAAYAGYASRLIGSLLLDTQPTPRAGYIKSGVQNLSRVTYAALRAWAIHNGLMVAPGVWAAGTIKCADNADGTTFRIYDVRGEFLRAWDDGRGVDSGRTVGGAQGDAIRNITGTFGDARTGVNASVSFLNASGAFASIKGIKNTVGNTTIIANTPDNPYIVDFDASRVVAVASENRPRNTALLAAIKF